MLQNRLLDLLRTRVVLCAVGLILVYKDPSISQWVVALVGMATGVSAIDAIRKMKDKES